MESVTTFTEYGFNPEDIGHAESIFALGNGYLGLRGTYDESDEEIGQESGMYINGVFETEPFAHLCKFKGFAENDQYTVNLPDWRIFDLYIDGEKACFSAKNIKEHERTLDFFGGKIDRKFVFETKSGKRADVNSIRLVSMERPHSAAVSYSVVAEADCEVKIISKIIKTPLINKKLVLHTEKECLNKDGIFLLTETNNSKMRAATAVSHKVFGSGDVCMSNNEESYTYEISTVLKRGEMFRVEKYAAMYSDVDKEDDIMESAKSCVLKDAEDGFETLLKEQRDYWSDVWEKGDIVIDGNEKDQQAVRFSLFHLRQQLPCINNASVGATGLTGANYSGKVFWDTEMYLMPYYNYTEPETCKGLLMYRYKILDKARERAQQMGGVGALYSWCSIDGEETSLVFEASTAEYHINSDIAYAIKRYKTITEDNEFIHNYCAEILFETAKFMAHRGCFSEARGGRFCINSVCGPDEYACGVNNNCYTNFMVREHLYFALEVYEEMCKNAPQKLFELAEKVGLDDAELTLWKDAADKMYYHKNEELGVYEQDDTFIYNDPVDMNTIPRNYDIRGMFHPLDLWRLQVLKQADVVLLNFVLGDKFTLEEKKKNFDYYEPKTNHGSSLSPAVHSIMANEIGYYDMAYDFFEHTVYMDIEDVKKNTSGGVHMACLGSVWMCVVNGFLGMRDYGGKLEFTPNIPKAWKKYSCKIFYKGSRIAVTVTDETADFTLTEGRGMSFNVNGNEYSVDAENSTVRVLM